MDKDKEDLQLCTACLRDNEKIEALHWCCDCTETQRSSVKIECVHHDFHI